MGLFFPTRAGRSILVSVCDTGCCGDFGVEEIGFVLRKKAANSWQGGVDRRYGQNTEDRKQNAEDGFPNEGDASKCKTENCGIPSRGDGRFDWICRPCSGFYSVGRMVMLC